MGRSLRLAVVVLKAEGSHTPADPVVYLSGGPGISALTYDLPNFGEWLDLPFQPTRDIVLFDQRGTRFAEPSLVCPEERAPYQERLGKPLSVDAEVRQAESIALSCGTRLRAEGADLTDYQNKESAADVGDVMRALGYDTWNIYAFSYGARVALTALRDHPQGIRAVVLDSPSSPGEHSELRAQHLRDALEQVIGACMADQPCAVAYPGFGAEFDGVLERLAERPVHLTSTSGVAVLLTAERFIDALFRQFRPDLIARLPADIAAFAGGDVAGLQPYADVLATGWPGIASGATVSTSCAEDVPFASTVTGEATSSIVRKDIVGGVRLFTALWPANVVGGPAEVSRAQRFCQQWGVSATSSPVDAPILGDTPVLILRGEYDPGIPPSNVSEISALLQHASVVTVRNAAHGVGFTYPLCVGAMAAAFLDAPASAPDDSCLAGIPKIDWRLP